MTQTGGREHLAEIEGNPHLCHTGSDAMLVSDCLNDRMMLKNEGEKSYVLLEPPPAWPCDAAYIGGALFVLSEQELCYKLIKYVVK